MNSNNVGIWSQCPHLLNSIKLPRYCLATVTHLISYLVTACYHTNDSSKLTLIRRFYNTDLSCGAFHHHLWSLSSRLWSLSSRLWSLSSRLWSLSSSSDSTGGAEDALLQTQGSSIPFLSESELLLVLALQRSIPNSKQPEILIGLVIRHRDCSLSSIALLVLSKWISLVILCVCKPTTVKCLPDLKKHKTNYNVF